MKKVSCLGERIHFDKKPFFIGQAMA